MFRAFKHAIFSTETLILSNTTLVCQIKKKTQLLVSILEYIYISMAGACSYNALVVFQTAFTKI